MDQYIPSAIAETDFGGSYVLRSLSLLVGDVVRIVIPLRLRNQGHRFFEGMTFSAEVTAALEKSSTAYEKRFDETGHVYIDKE